MKMTNAEKELDRIFREWAHEFDRAKWWRCARIDRLTLELAKAEKKAAGWRLFSLLLIFAFILIGCVMVLAKHG